MGIFKPFSGMLRSGFEDPGSMVEEGAEIDELEEAEERGEKVESAENGTSCG
jgi:hypothetical protein